jgi:alpha-glucosidase (family GH31 glycosyl hydrolase)
MLTTSNRWREAVDKNILAKDSLGNPFTYDFYFGNTGLIDIYSDKGNAWFKNIYKDLSKMDVTGFWGDLGEPEVHPSVLIHATGTADEVHNIYGHDWAKLVYEASLEAAPDKRPFILMRAGYSGSQRYGLIPWSGDVNRTWGGLQSQPEIALQMGMQGLAYMHSDLGGFAGVNLDDELYVRWLQYGVFQPIFRPHAQEDVPSEPIFRSDKAKFLAKKAIELRYKLLPYNYNLAFENHKDGKPLMRPLFFEENNLELFNYSKAYLWGNDILVSPVLEAGKTSQDVYFPKGSKWFDFYSDILFAGGKTHSIALNEATIPTFIRGGAFIPMAKPMPTTKDYTGDNFELHYYFDWAVAESEREFYNDNGFTPNVYENGAFEKLEFEAELKRTTLEFEFETDVKANFLSNSKQIQLIIHNIDKQPKRIRINRKRVDIIWNATKKTVTIPANWNSSEGIEITIKLKK